MNIKTLYTTYNGRISRSQYWLGLLGLIILSILVGITIGTTGLAVEGETSIVETLFSLVMMALGFALYIKRFHDLGKSGWFSLLMLVPLVNIAVGLFWLGFVKGDDGANEYGADPLAGANNVTVE